MAVELRCPDCRAKLRLPEEPEPGSDVECPECNAVFPAPDPDTGEVPDGRVGKKKGKKGEDKKKFVPKDKTPNMRKAKLKEPNKTALTLVIVGAVLFVSLVVGLLIWYFSRKPASYEMMNYLPVDATHAVGVHIGHMHRYAEFKKAVEPTYAQQGFQRAIEALAKAFGIDTDDVPDYVVQGWGKSGGGALVIRTKKEFDPSDLKKLPGAVEGKLDGEIYYSIPPMAKLIGGANLKVFAPTKRLVVFSDYNLPQATFQGMLTGNKGGDGLNTRLGSLGKRTTRGTFWIIQVLETADKPKEPDKKDIEAGKGALQGEMARSVAKAKGMGFKCSLGSRAIRFEVATWFEDSDAPYEIAKKYNASDSELRKAQDDSSLSPPRYWKEIAENLVGSKKVANEMFTNLSIKSSGDLLIVSTEAETKNVMEILQSLSRKITGEGQGAMGGMQQPPPGIGGNGPGGPPVPPVPQGGGGGVLPGPMGGGPGLVNPGGM